MKTFVVYFLVVASLLSASLANADKWIYGMTINNVQALSDGGFIIYGPKDSGINCPETGRLFYVRDGHNLQTAAGVKTALSIALVAFTSGKTVTLLYDEIGGACDVERILVNK